MNKPKMIQIATPCMGEEEWQALREPIENAWLTQGAKVAAFEKEFAKYHNVKHAMATTSCTTALHMALLAVGVGAGDAVIVPSFTWVATANAVEYCGATPIFCDINPYTYNIDVASAKNRIEEAIRKGLKVKAIMPVHLFGLYADMNAVLEIAKEYQLKVVEDAACASGATYWGKTAGTLGDVGCFSFHPRKVLVTGEGGMCTTDDDELAAKINCLRNHGASVSEEQRHYGNAPYLLPEFNILGYNYRMTDLQGAIGLVQINKLDQFIKERQKWAEFYSRELKNIHWLTTPFIPDGYNHSWQSYVCFVDEAKAPVTRNKIMEFLYAKGIATRPGTQAVHMLGYYKNKFNIKPDDFPNARDCNNFTMAIPLHNCMTAKDFEYVVETLKEIR